MPTYFKPLRRKIGLVTLAVACLFAAGWVRSLRVAEEVMVYQTLDSTGLIAKATFVRLRSMPGYVVLFLSCEGSEDIPASEWVIYQAATPKFTSNGITPEFLKTARFSEWPWLPCGIAVGEVNYSWPVPGTGVWVSAIHFSYVTIPMTLLSAWLLLSKPRAKMKTESTSQPES